MAPVIVAQNLYKCYPGFPPVLRGVNINVEPGEMVAIMGPSGCGKSTMLHVLGMLHAPDSGTLKVLDTDVLTLNREQTASFRRGNMGFVMQSSNLFDHSTVFENVEFPLIYENIPPEERWERVIRALELVRLSHRVSYRSNRLSGGEQQRVAIARAMVNSPRILLADEPTGALDSRTSKVVMENFRTLAHEGGIAMVIVTHDAGVADYCDSVYTLDEGVLHCHRHDAVPEHSGQTSLLRSEPRRMNAVCVVGDFPRPCGTAAIQDVLSLHAQRVLTRVYALSGAGLANLGGGEYSLPVPIRRQGMFSLPGSVLALMRRTRANAARIWQYWARLPLNERLNVFRASKHFWHFAQGARMTSWCLADKVEHIHALGGDAPATAAWVASGALGVPFSFSIHRSALPKQLPLIAVKALDAAFVRCDTRETLEAVAEACLALKPDFSREKLCLLRDGLTMARPSSEDEIPGAQGQTAQGEVQLLAAGHMSRRKGFSTLLKACALLKKSSVPFRLTLAGAGPRLWRLRWQALWLGLRKRVVFAGQVPHEHMADLFRKAHIFVAPGISLRTGEQDGIPTALAEAMVNALPVVASDIAGHKEVLENGKNALLVPQGDAAAMSEALLELMRFPEKAEALGQQAQQDALNTFELENEGQVLANMLLAHRSPSKG